MLPQLRRRAVDYLKQHQKESPEKPLFLYLPLPAPHTPWLPTRRYQGKSSAGEYGDFTFQVDSVVGEVLSTIEELGIYENTLVIFTSDNGPVWYPADVERFNHKSTGPLRGMKGDAWEGGHRMPFVVRWPGRVRAGGPCHQMICHTDLMATLAAILQFPLPV